MSRGTEMGRDVRASGADSSSASRTGSVAPQPANDDLLSRLRGQCQRQGTRAALLMEQEGFDLTLTYDDLWRRASRVAGGLSERGIKPGDRIAILSESRPEWAICLIAAWLAEAIVVPLDYMLEESELLNVLADSTPHVLLTSEKHLKTGSSLALQADSLKNQFLINGRCATMQIETLCDLEVATPRGLRQVASDETALIVYTSGTMGRPKGVVTTFGALLFQVSAIRDRFDLTADDRSLSILPLNHLMELTVVLLGPLHAGGSVVYAHSLFPADILRLLRNDRITIIVGVPIFFRALHNNIMTRIGGQSLPRRCVFRAALGVSRYIPFRSVRRLVFLPLYRYLGSTLRFCASGGAYLEPSLARFFDRLGIPLLQGYGLTETGPVISVNGLGMNRAGSVGKPLEGVEVRIDRGPEGHDSDGEILTRGPHLMAGYYNASQEEERHIDSDGWFHTGDIGELHPDGYLYVTGRLKNVIVLDSGKNVQPEEVEETILQCPLVRECCVIGRPAQHGSFKRKEEVYAVVVPTDAVVAAHDGDDAAIQDAVEAAVMQQARGLATFKRPVAVQVSFSELPKSPIQKVKRNLVRELFGSGRHHMELD